jgi:hypothetical protein
LDETSSKRSAYTSRLGVVLVWHPPDWWHG